MPIAPSARIHATAIIDPRAEIGDDVQVGPHVIIDGPARVGTGCILGPGVHLMGTVILGAHNEIFSHAVIGERPQHLGYKGEPTRVEIGDHNIIREHVTIHRATTANWVTRVGNYNLLMASSHVAHDCVVGDRCLFANSALIGGHCIVEDNVYLGGNCGVHQFVRVGRLALLSGASGTTKDIPPFMISQYINCVAGVNIVGMRRAGIPAAGINGVRRAFQILYRQHLTIPQALERIEAELPGIPEVAELVTFIRNSTRGITLNITRHEAA